MYYHLFVYLKNTNNNIQDTALLFTTQYRGDFDVMKYRLKYRIKDEYVDYGDIVTSETRLSSNYFRNQAKDVYDFRITTSVKEFESLYGVEESNTK